MIKKTVGGVVLGAMIMLALVMLTAFIFYWWLTLAVAIWIQYGFAIMAYYILGTTLLIAVGILIIW